MSTLTESILALQTPSLISSLAARTGVPDSKIRTGMNAATGAVMDALASKAHHPRTMAEAAAVIAAAPDLDDPVLVLDDGSPVRKSGRDLLRLATRDIAGMRDHLGRNLGLGAGTTMSVLGAAAGLVVGALRRFTHSIGDPVDGSTLSSALLEERPALHDAMPVDLTMTHGQVARPSVRPSERSTFRKARQPGHRSASWLLLLALIPLALIVAWFATQPRDRTDELTTTAPLVREPATSQPGATGATEPTTLAPVIDLPPSPEEPSIGPVIETQHEPPVGAQPAESSTMTPRPPFGTQPAQPADERSTLTPQQPSGTQHGGMPSMRTPQEPGR